MHIFVMYYFTFFPFQSNTISSHVYNYGIKTEWGSNARHIFSNLLYAPFYNFASILILLRIEERMPLLYTSQEVLSNTLHHASQLPVPRTFPLYPMSSEKDVQSSL